MPKISIIVPVFNTEKYLERCVEHLCAQTVRDTEILLIDDGSTDSSPLLCDRLQKEDDRIRVIHKSNGGLSSARNAGLIAARGEFISFVDSDDTAAPTFLEELLQKIERYACDFVFCDFTRIEPGKAPVVRSAALHCGYYNKKEIQRCVYPQLIMRKDLEYGPLLSVCVCLYRAAFLRENHLFFDESIRYSEDHLFSIEAGYRANAFFYLKGKGLYEYRRNPGSITTTRSTAAWDHYRRMNEKLSAQFGNCQTFDFHDQLSLHLVHYACAALGQAAALPNKAQREELSRILHDPALQTALNSLPLCSFPIKLRIQLFCMRHRRISLLCLWLQRRARYA